MPAKPEPGVTWPHIVLASASPRRQEMMRRLGVDFSVVVAGIEEIRQPGEDAAAYVRRMSADKAAATLGRAGRSRAAGAGRDLLVIAADTVVVRDGVVLEKPRDPDDAVRMLMTLQGRSHEVLTGVTIRRASIGTGEPGASAETVGFTESTTVHMRPLNEAAIRWYVATGDPLDKAGSYGIQGVGGFMVDAISGSYDNVVGLPVARMLQVLEEKFGLMLWSASMKSES